MTDHAKTSLLARNLWNWLLYFCSSTVIIGLSFLHSFLKHPRTGNISYMKFSSAYQVVKLWKGDITLFFRTSKFFSILRTKYSIKQFVVTNRSKERPGSIVTEILKSGILIPIATSKELHFNADFKYISFIQFGLTHKKLRAWENSPYFRKMGETPPPPKKKKNHRILTKITPSHSVYQRTPLKKFQASIYKNVELGIFC